MSGTTYLAEPEPGGLFTLPGGVSAMLTPRERMSMSQWALRNFVIAEKGAVSPGPYDLELTPYWREPMDAAGDPFVRWMNLVASAQVGKTQLGSVVLAYYADQRPVNMLYVRPTEPDVVEAYRDRFKPMIEANLPHLIPARGEWINSGSNPMIALASCTIYGAAATIARHMTSRSTPLVLYDETDTAEDSANSLGNVLALLDERQMAGASFRSLTMGMSTPKYETGSNWDAYENRSDRREYWEPCPHCGFFQPLVLDRIRVPADCRDPHAIRSGRLAWYECMSCGEAIAAEWQGWMADRGVWCPADREIAEALPLHDDDITTTQALAILPDAERWVPRFSSDAPLSPHRGYRVWRANTKFDQCSWSHIIARHFECGRDPEKRQVFFNNWLALPWKVAVEAADEDMVRSRAGAYERGTVPDGVKVILVGADCQHDCIWFTARGFGANQESWLIDYGRMEIGAAGGASDLQAVLALLYERVLYRGWPVNGHPGVFMRAYAMAVDSGDQTDDVYNFCMRPAAIPVKGRDSADFRVKASLVERKDRPDKVQLWHVNNKAFRQRMQRMIKAQPGDPGEWHLPAEVTEEYVLQLTSEHLIKKTKNATHATWQLKSPGRANHMLDAENYTLALAEALEQLGELGVMSIRETDQPVGRFNEGGNAFAAAKVSKRKRRRGRVQSFDDFPSR